MIWLLVPMCSCNLPAVEPTADWAVETTKATSMSTRRPHSLRSPLYSMHYYMCYFPVSFSQLLLLDLPEKTRSATLNVWKVPPSWLLLFVDLFEISHPPSKTLTYVTKHLRPVHLDPPTFPAFTSSLWSGKKTDMQAGILTPHILLRHCLFVSEKELQIDLSDLWTSFWCLWLFVYQNNDYIVFQVFNVDSLWKLYVSRSEADLE